MTETRLEQQILVMSTSPGRFCGFVYQPEQTHRPVSSLRALLRYLDSHLQMRDRAKIYQSCSMQPLITMRIIREPTAILILFRTNASDTVHRSRAQPSAAILDPGRSLPSKVHLRRSAISCQLGCNWAHKIQF